MRLELAERLRCPMPHASTPLVVIATRAVDRELIDGLAGCPVCHREAAIRNGDIAFAGAPTAKNQTAERTDDIARDRLIALLGLAEPGGAVLLTGRYVAHAAALIREMDVAVICLNATLAKRVDGVNTVSIASGSVPFTDGTFRAVALDASLDAATVADAVRAVVVGGRVLGALPLARPMGVRELARDEQEWVGERETGAGAVVPLRRA